MQHKYAIDALRHAIRTRPRDQWDIPAAARVMQGTCDYDEVRAHVGDGRAFIREKLDALVKEGLLYRPDGPCYLPTPDATASWWNVVLPLSIAFAEHLGDGWQARCSSTRPAEAAELFHVDGRVLSVYPVWRHRNDRYDGYEPSRVYVRGRLPDDVGVVTSKQQRTIEMTAKLSRPLKDIVGQLARTIERYTALRCQLIATRDRPGAVGKTT